MGYFWNKKPQPKAEVKKIGSQQSFSTMIEAPKAVISKNKDYVLNGLKNGFPLELIELKNNSGIHSAIINSSTRMTVGTGIQFASTEEESEQIYNDLPEEVKQKIKSFSEKINPNNNINQIMYKVVRDYKTYGYCFMEVIWNLDHTSPIRINYIDASKIAIGKKNDKNQITHFYYSSDWSDNKIIPSKIAIFNSETKEANQLIFINNDSQGSDYYGLPDYYAGVKWIKADGVNAGTNLNSVENGFSPNVMIKYYVDPTETQKAEIVNSFKKTMTGFGSKLLFLFWPDKENAPEVEPIEVENFNERTIGLNDMITQQIVSVHRIHPALASIQTPGKLGYSNELLSAYKIYFETVVKPEREIFESILTKLFKMNGIDLNIYFNTPKLVDEPKENNTFKITAN